jgi:hypothetical protein
VRLISINAIAEMMPWMRSRELNSTSGRGGPVQNRPYVTSALSVATTSRASNLKAILSRTSPTQIILVFRRVPKRLRQVRNQEQERKKKRRGDTICNKKQEKVKWWDGSMGRKA